MAVKIEGGTSYAPVVWSGLVVFVYMAACAAVYLFVETAVPKTSLLFAEMLAPGFLSPVIVVVFVCLN